MTLQEPARVRLLCSLLFILTTVFLLLIVSALFIYLEFVLVGNFFSSLTKFLHRTTRARLLKIKSFKSSKCSSLVIYFNKLNQSWHNPDDSWWTKNRPGRLGRFKLCWDDWDDWDNSMWTRLKRKLYLSFSKLLEI